MIQDFQKGEQKKAQDASPASKLKIVVASQSPLKLEAVNKALSERNIHAEVISVAANSDIPAQPLNEQTEQGAKNRLTHARQLTHDADLYIAIENGIFGEAGYFFDKAVVLIETKDGSQYITHSKSVECPAEYVAEARRRGFDNTTVGMVMVEMKMHDPTFVAAAREFRLSQLADAVSENLGNTLGWIQEHDKTLLNDVRKLVP